MYPKNHEDEREQIKQTHSVDGPPEIGQFAFHEPFRQEEARRYDKTK
jgi:hypothetical protein